MKCPKCGFNSFEFLDACKKCGSEFASFKKAHRINPVILRPGDVPAAKENQVAPRDFMSAPVQVQAESPAFAADGEFSWEVPGESATSAPADSLYSGFNLDLPDPPPSETKDMEFTGFSFDTEPSPDNASSQPELHGDEFSFGETTAEEAAPPLWETQPEEPGSEMEKYQRMLEPDSMGEPLSAFDAENTKGGDGYFGVGDFSFAPEQATEDIFLKEEEPAVSTLSEKKAQPDLENFDKEFEMIFAVEDQTDPEEKTGQ